MIIRPICTTNIGVLSVFPDFDIAAPAMNHFDFVAEPQRQRHGFQWLVLVLVHCVIALIGAKLICGQGGHVWEPDIFYLHFAAL